MKKIIIECEIHSELDFLPDNAQYKGQFIEIKTRRNPKSGKYESTLTMKVTEYS